MTSMDEYERWRVKAGSRVRLGDFDPRADLGLKKERAERELEDHRRRLADLHQLLWAENRRALLIVLQGMDTSGKDSTIRHVMSGINPQGCTVTSFKRPSEEEADHGFLWRIHRAVPARGDIGIFNRSHYEDVLVVRVRGLAPERVWRRRYEQINAFEKLLADNAVTILKFFLHISKGEQGERLQERLEDPTKNWKFSANDLEERKLWDEYQRAYEEALARCSTEHASWHIVPADRKWVRNWMISRVIVDTMQAMKMTWPRVAPEIRAIRIP
jgi:PPK2 family polyphosphate:nucleotide phosphotransferase